MKPPLLKRHVVSIMRPSAELDERGQPKAPTTVADGVYASIEDLNGRELEIARQLSADADKRIRFYVSADWNLTTNDYLVHQGKQIGLGHIAFHEGVILEAECLGQSAAD